MATVFRPGDDEFPELEPVVPVGDEEVQLSDNDDLPPLDDAWAEDPRLRTQRLTEVDGDLSGFMSDAALVELGNRVVDDYEEDKQDRKDWEDTARASLDSAKQIVRDGVKTFPWDRASDIDYPMMTTAALQFNARMYPAVVKGDEAILCKVIGQDNGKPVMGPDGKPLALAPDGGPITAEQAMQMPPEMAQQLQPQWEIAPGAKTKRARRVSEYLNHKIFYGMDGWEEDTDTLLFQLPIVGCGFRKVWYDPDEGCKTALVSALNLYAPMGAKMKTTPRLTEAQPDVYPYEITEKILTGFYRDPGDKLYFDPQNDAKPRLQLEQYRRIDLDGDGYPEPYIVTVDHETRTVLRVERNFDQGDIKWREAAAAVQTVPNALGDPDVPVAAEVDTLPQIAKIKGGRFFIKYSFIPDPDGGFYDVGLGQLLRQVGAVVNSSINQLMDAGAAQTAGGGFIGSGVRLQTRGNRGVIKMAPGEYKVLDVSGDNLRANIVERTLPNVSPVTFQILELVLGAAKDISGAKDVITGEASNQGQVGTTLALIEQGLQVFNAIAKRTFRSLKEEFVLLYENEGKYGGERAAQEYADLLDDPEADFAKDFEQKGLDIRPVSDPAAITRMQKMARAQFTMSTVSLLGAVGGDAREALRRIYEAVDMEDIDKLLPPPQPPAQDPMQAAMAELQMKVMMAKAGKDAAGADKTAADAAVALVDGQIKQYELQRMVTRDGMAMAAEAEPGPQTGADILGGM